METDVLQKVQDAVIPPQGLIGEKNNNKKKLKIDKKIEQICVLGSECGGEIGCRTLVGGGGQEGSSPQHVTH